MKIELVGVPTEDDLLWCKECALGTVGKAVKTLPTTEWLHKMLEARHSPIRELWYRFRIIDVPYWVSVHFVRHHMEFHPYVQSQRNDRQNNYDRRKAPQDSPVTMRISMNAEMLMILANKRLCSKASAETREAVAEMCRLVESRCPEFKGLLVPMCVYHGGVCHEIEGCGRCISMGNKISHRNYDGYPDPTAYSALSAVQRKHDMDDDRVQNFLCSMRTIINQSGYDLLTLIEIRDRRTGRDYR